MLLPAKTRECRTTVVVPCYNDGGTLPATVGSVRGHGEPLDLIVVDDGSTEPTTIAVIRELERAGVRIVQQENRGPSAARMAGVAAASTEYVFAIDADDLIAPDTLTQLADALDANAEKSFAYGNYKPFGAFRLARVTAEQLDPWLISYWNSMPVGALFRRNVLISSGGWTLRDYEDWDLWMKLAEQGRQGVYVPVIVYYHRLHGVRRHTRALERHDEFVRELRERHPTLFGRRRENRRRSSAPWVARRLYPLIETSPLAERRKTLLYGLVLEISARRWLRRLLVCARERRSGRLGSATYSGASVDPLGDARGERRAPGRGLT